ncbi:MAG: DUF3828 domain-containing protein [Prevotella sp.]|jgi:hypothetical protein|nr:DUF3828 domain-containing protein [Prevotella sp.]MBO7129174.1 DUF3828 domain-containing protein [Prevotella sp.]
MKRIILLCCIAMALTGCSNKDKANIIPQGSDAPPVEGISVNNGDKQDSADPELITDRVNAIYAAVAEAYPEINDITPSNDQLDDAYCTSEWKTLVQMVNSKSAENMGRESFFDADYWIMGQDWGKITISDLKVNVKDNTHANAFFTLHNLGSATKVQLELLFERGEWLIGNFIDETHKKDWKKSMVQYLEKKGKQAQEESSDDGIIEYSVP